MFDGFYSMLLEAGTVFKDRDVDIYYLILSVEEERIIFFEGIRGPIVWNLRPGSRSWRYADRWLERGYVRI